MHRQPLITLLADYQRRYPAEKATVETFKTFVNQHPRCFDRSLAVGHITGSAWLVNRHHSHVLLTHHRKLNRWLQLGGHADGQPDVLAVALREAREESGIHTLHPQAKTIFDLDIHLIPEHNDEPPHYHYDVRFAVQAVATEQFTVSAESHSLAWIEVAKLHEKTLEESMLRMARKWLAQSG